MGHCSANVRLSTSTSDESEPSALEGAADALLEGVDDASRTTRACRNVQTSQRTVRRDSCKIRGRRSS